MSRRSNLKKGSSLDQVRRNALIRDHVGVLAASDPALSNAKTKEERGEILHHRGISEAHLGRLGPAIESLTASLQEDPSKARVWTNMARLQQRAGARMAAIGSALTASKIEPSLAEAQVVLGDLFREARRPKMSIGAYERALELHPGLETALGGLALARTSLGDARGASEIYRDLINRFPNDRRYRINLATNLAQVGSGAEAAEVALTCIPDQEVSETGQALIITSRALGLRLQHAAPDPKILGRAERLAASSSAPWLQRASLLSNLGRAADRAGDRDRAFGFWTEQNRIAAEHSSYQPKSLETYTALMRALYTRDRLERWRALSDRGERPVLILGMPRSGTTLVEQILGQHPHVDAGGELYDLADVAREFLPNGEPNWSVAALEAGIEERIRRTGSVYASALEEYRTSGLVVTDKMPENFKMVGIAAALMPNLKVIHMVRDPVDVCFSIWKLQFDNTGHAYGHRFADLAHYYRIHEELMAHWGQVLPGVIHRVRYEELVAEPERVGRGLVEHCGLDWSPDLLDFTDAERGVRTASAAQVREGLNTKGIGRWRDYGPHLAGLLAALEREGLRPTSDREGVSCIT